MRRNEIQTPNGLPRAAVLTTLTLVVLLVLPLLGAASAFAKGGGGGGHGGNRPEVRVAGSCGRGASSNLKVKARDGGLEVEFEVEHTRANARWHIVLVQERQVAWRGSARTHAPSGSFSLERRLSDFPGPDQVMARGVGPRGITCQATAVLPG
jgi:hypothetical protein